MVFIEGVLGAKRLELPRQIVPKATTIAVLVNPNNPEAVSERSDVQAAALAIGQQLLVLDVSSDRDIEPAFATFVQSGAGALFVGTGAFFFSPSGAHRCAGGSPCATGELCPARARRGRRPDESTRSSLTDAYRQAGIYAGRVLKGEKPADLPVMRSTKFEFVINLKTAKALGLTVSQSLLVAADEVIE